MTEYKQLVLKSIMKEEQACKDLLKELIDNSVISEEEFKKSQQYYMKKAETEEILMQAMKGGSNPNK